MAEDGTSALTSVSQRTFVTAASSPATYATRPAEPSNSTTVTAEIPAVPAGPSYGVLLPDGSVWYPGSQRRLPAPLLLRVVVWVLAFACLLAGAGVFVIHSHPSWVNPFRRVVVTHPGAAARGGGSTHTNGHSGTSPGGGSPSTAAFGPLVPQPAGLPQLTTAYRVPTGAYTVTVTEAIGHLAWVAAYNSTNGQRADLFQQQTLSGGQSFTVNTSNPIVLEVAALGATVQVSQNGKTLGTLPSPVHVPWNWWFTPASSSATSSSTP